MDPQALDCYGEIPTIVQMGSTGGPDKVIGLLQQTMSKAS